jgi:hypothetical protein
MTTTIHQILMLLTLASIESQATIKQCQRTASSTAFNTLREHADSDAALANIFLAQDSSTRLSMSSDFSNSEEMC